MNAAANRSPISANRSAGALLGSIGAVSTLRLVGFVSVIVGVRVPAVLAVQYVAIGLTMILGLLQIGRGRGSTVAIPRAKK